MDYNSYKKYFKPKNFIMQIIGGFIAACSIPCFFIRGFGTMMGVVIIAFGACLIIFANGARPNDSEIDGAIALRVKDIDELAIQRVDSREKLIKAFPPVTFGEYDYSDYNNTSGDFLIQQGRDGKYRTNKYSSAQILFAQEKLHILMYQFYLTKDESDTKYFDCKYTSLQSAVIERKNHNFIMYSGKKEQKINLDYESIVIRDNDGNVVFDMPVHEGADVDKAIESINRLIEAKTTGSAEIK